MAQSLASTGTSAQIFAHPNVFAPPVVQGKLQGRHPKSIALLWRARDERRKAAREAQSMVEKIDACKQSIAFLERHARDCATTLSALSSKNSPSHSGVAHG